MKKIYLMLFALIVIACGEDEMSTDLDKMDPDSDAVVTTENLTATVNNGPAKGLVIGTVKGEANEGNLTFSIKSQTPTGALAIDAESGELSVNNATLFDFSTNPEIVAIVNVTNGEVSKEANITITVLGVALSDFSATIAENPANGQKIGTITGTTNEGSIIYSIISQSPDAAFDVDQSSGELTVSDSALFDFEINPTLTAKVLGVNGEVKDSATVTISLTDVAEIKTVQQKLNDGMTPLAIYNEDNALLDELYGKTYQGGLIFYFDKNDGSGIVAAPSDQSDGYSWGCDSKKLGFEVTLPGGFKVFNWVASRTGITSGQANTTDILNYCTGASAAKVCSLLELNDYDDWYLPTRDELREFLTKIPQENGSYWSSSQEQDESSFSAWYVDTNGARASSSKSNKLRVRAVRSFEEPVIEGRK